MTSQAALQAEGAAQEVNDDIENLFSDLDLDPSWAMGFFAALHSGPKRVTPNEWVPYLVEEPSEHGESLELLVKLSDELAVQLQMAPETLCPEPDNVDDVAEFCSGYVAGARLQPLWGTDDLAVLRLLPFAALAGEIEDEIHGPDDKPLADRPAWEQMHRERLSAHVAATYAYWRSKPRASKKVGRNDPCPCGSGNKYKKCCI
jgi:uncharacterized protein